MLALGLLLLAAGCGQKGALTLAAPTPTPMAASSAASAASK
jgi:predicted small lipoprotein YifL